MRKHIFHLLLLSLLFASVAWVVGTARSLQAAQNSSPTQQTTTTQAQPTQLLPDLVITSIQLSPANPGVGVPTDVIITVKNQGNETTSGTIALTLYVEPATVPPVQSTPNTVRYVYGLPLPPNGVFSFTRTQQSFTSTPPKVYAWVDPPWENRITESDESNNFYPASTQSGADAYEDDDSCPNAQEVATDGSEQVRNLYRQTNEEKDVDWIKLNGVGNVTYYAQAIVVGADADLALELLGACDGPPSLGNGATVTFTAPTNGVYYLKLYHNASTYGPNTDYRFRVTSDANCSERFEPNNLCAEAGDLNLGSPQEQIFCKPGDLDWVHFPVQAGASYQVRATNGGANANLRLTLYKSCSDSQSTVNGIAIADGSTGGQTIQITATQAGLLYLKSENSNPNQHGAGSNYRLRVDAVNNEGCSADAHEEDDTQATAHTLNVNTLPQVHNVCPAGEEDWSQFEATDGTTYTIETLNPAKASDTILCLYNAQGKRLECDDDDGDGKASRIVWPATESGTYFVRIADNDDKVAGPDTQYDLRISTTSCNKDTFESDNSRNEAKPVIVDGSTQNHNICPAGDEDWASFSATANTAYLIKSLPVGSEADTVIELYDANGTKLAQNDDYTTGAGSQVGYTIQQAGSYYVKVRHYNPARFGTGTEYLLRIGKGTATPEPTASPTPPPTPSPTATPAPPTSTVDTLILVNASRLATLYGEGETNKLLDKLATLARHPQVKGEIIRLEQNPALTSAYTDWQAEETSVEKANQVSSAIRTLIFNYLDQHTGVDSVVLVGEDRALPFRRIKDHTPNYPEKTYRHSSPSHPTGAAQHDNYFLSDDYYVDRKPASSNGRELYLPDLAIGRLVETPSEMTRVIDAFLANPETDAQQILISGYDFVQDMATAECKDWQKDFGDARVNCSLIGDSWTGQNLRDLQLRTTQPFLIQSISGHANHFTQGSPKGNPLQAHEILNGGMNWDGGLIYTPACHAGLNLPASNLPNATDLPQAVLSRGANYVANTGYGWGSPNGMAYSERLMRLYGQALLKGAQTSMGGALVRAKSEYYRENDTLDAYDEKSLQQVIFYGLPMRQVKTGSSLDNLAPFPAVAFTATLPLAGDGLVRGYATIDFTSALASDQDFTLAGNAQTGHYYALNDSTHASQGEPVQPRFFHDLEHSLPVRGVLLRSARFTTQNNFTIAVTSPYNEYTAADPTLTPLNADDLANPLAWYPSTLTAIQRQDAQSTFVTQLGQYNPASEQLRLYNAMQTEFFFSESSDQNAPEISLVDGVLDATNGQVMVKVETSDPSSIEAVVVSYFNTSSVNASTESAGQTQLQSSDLTFDPATHKWHATFAGDRSTRYWVQVVDKAGNVQTATNKGEYYAFDVEQQPFAITCTGVNGCLFLPVVMR